VRWQAKRDTALDVLLNIKSKAPSTLRSAGALQTSAEALGHFHSIRFADDTFEAKPFETAKTLPIPVRLAISCRFGTFRLLPGSNSHLAQKNEQNKSKR
jgi:hypothetical protein